MPTIGFWELTLVALIALIVVGPKRLPTLAHTLGTWVRQAQLMMKRLQSEINSELEQSDIKSILPGENEPGEIDRLIMESEKLKAELQNLGTDVDKHKNPSTTSSEFHDHKS